MSNTSQTFAEGAFINKPPLFAGENYPFWKIRMKICLESVDKGVWDAVVNGPFKPIKIVERKNVLKEFSQWTLDENKRAHYDVRAKNIISSTLTLDEFYRVSMCESAKEMWDVLEVTHEGTNEVKRVRKNTLIQEYEMFRMKSRESICDVQKRFTHIVNHLLALDKTFDKEGLNTKILKSLNRTWQPKVTAISKSRDLTSMNIATLFGKLREHELELGRLKEEEDGEKRHTIALKSAVKSAAKLKKAESANDSNDDYNFDSEALRLMVKGFSKFLKYKNKSNSNSAEIKRSSRKQEKHVPTYYECGKMGHIKPECPILKLKQKLKEKGEADKHKKKRKAYNSDYSSSSESDGSIEEETNLCLMAGTSSSKSNVSSFNSNDDENNYYELLDAFNELHKEATKLQKSNN